MCRDLELSLRFVALHVGVWGPEALRWAGDFAASACTRRRVSRFRAPVVIPRCMMCTLPSEGVSFCLSAAAKSLLNKKADVKVRELVSLSPIWKPVFFPPLSLCPWLPVHYAKVLLCSQLLLSSRNKYVAGRAVHLTRLHFVKCFSLWQPWSPALFFFVFYDAAKRCISTFVCNLLSLSNH